MAAELIGITATDSIDNPRAVLTYKVTELTAGDDDDSQVRSHLSFTTGSPYPLSSLSCICKEITIVEWWDPTTALVQAVFGGTRFSLHTRTLASYDIDLRNSLAPYFTKIEQVVGGPGGQTRFLGWYKHDPINRVRGVIRKYDYTQRSAILSDSEANFIAQQVGKGYFIGGIPYIFVGATTTSSSNGITIIRYAFATNAALREMILPSAMKIPALLPLEEYREPVSTNDPNAQIEVVTVAQNYEEGEPLP